MNKFSRVLNFLIYQKRHDFPVFYTRLIHSKPIFQHLFPKFFTPVVMYLPGRSSRSQMFFKMGVLKNFAIFTWKHQCWSIFLMKLQAFGPAILLKGYSNTATSSPEQFKKHFFASFSPSSYSEKVRWGQGCPTPTFSFEYCEIFKNTFFTEHLLTTVLFRPSNYFSMHFKAAWKEVWARFSMLEHLWWSFFPRVINGFKVLTIIAK